MILFIQNVYNRQIHKIRNQFSDWKGVGRESGEWLLMGIGAPLGVMKMFYN